MTTQTETTDTAHTAAATLKTAIVQSGLLHDPAGLTDTDINHIVTAAAHQLHTATDGNPDRLLNAITDH